MTNAPRTTGRKLCLVALAFVFLLAQLCDALHKAEVRHVRCAEHGEWHHVAGTDGVVAAFAQDTTPRGPEARSTRTSIEVDEHCDSLSPQRERLLVWNVRPIVERSPATPAPTIAPAGVREPDSIARYRLAPKQSPPCS